MSEEYEIALVEDPERSVHGIIDRGLNDFNQQQAGDAHYGRICFALYAPDHEIVGGILGETHWNWLFIELLWIREDTRHHGYGHRLLVSLEEEGRRRGAQMAYLDTFSFQAPEFYKRHGYRVYGELKDFPPGHQRLYLMKEL